MQRDIATALSPTLAGLAGSAGGARKGAAGAIGISDEWVGGRGAVGEGGVASLPVSRNVKLRYRKRLFKSMWPHMHLNRQSYKAFCGSQGVLGGGGLLLPQGVYLALRRQTAWYICIYVGMCVCVYVCVCVCVCVCECVCVCVCVDMYIIYIYIYT
jgi:hypothetical protein